MPKIRSGQQPAPAYDLKETPFILMDNVLALTFSNKIEADGSIKSDLILEGDMQKIANVVIEHMNNHKNFKAVLLLAVQNYFERGGTV